MYVVYVGIDVIGVGVGVVGCDCGGGGSDIGSVDVDVGVEVGDCDIGFVFCGVDVCAAAGVVVGSVCVLLLFTMSYVFAVVAVGLTV